MAFSDTIFRWLASGRATVAGALAVYSAGDLAEAPCDLHGRPLVAISDPGQLGSATGSSNVLASDVTTYPSSKWKGISVNTSGVVNLVLFDPVTGTLGDQTRIYMAGGIIYPLSVYRVMSTGTDAALLAANQVVLYR